MPFSQKNATFLLYFMESNTWQRRSAEKNVNRKEWKPSRLPLFSACQFVVFPSFHQEVKTLKVSVEGRAAVEYLIAAWASGEFVDRGVVVFEGFTIERDACLHRLTCFKIHFLETFERLDGGIGIVECLDIDLHGFRPFTVARVGDRHSERHLAVNRHGGLGEFALTVLEGSVRKSIAKGELWFSTEVSVGAVIHRVVKEVWQVIIGTIEGDRQFS